MFESIFAKNIPASAKWIDINEIVNVLNTIGVSKCENHMFLPTGGGKDLLNSALSDEPGCIELNTEGSCIVKVKFLTFENVNNDFDTSYFRLELDALEPSGVYEESLNREGREELVELSPSRYIKSFYWDANEYQGKKLPKSARRVSRYFKGSFVIFSKTSEYNDRRGRFGDSYSAQHDNMDEGSFRSYITSD